jgi:HEAT repeat protein
MKKRWLLLLGLLLIACAATLFFFHYKWDDVLDWREGKQYRSKLTRSYRSKIRALRNAPPNASNTLLGKIGQIVGISLFQTDSPFSKDYKGNVPNPKLLPVILDLVEDRDGDIRLYAIPCLSSFGDNPEAIDSLIRQLEDKNINIRYYTYYTLGLLLGPKAKAARPRLRELSKDTGREDYVHAATALWLIDQDKEIALPTLIRALDDPNPTVRFYAATFFFSHASPETVAAVPDLEKFATVHREFNQELRSYAVLALGSIGKPAVPALIRILQDQECRACGLTTTALFALGKIGPDAKEAVPEVLLYTKSPEQIAGISEPSEQLREAAIESLKKIDPEVYK